MRTMRRYHNLSLSIFLLLLSVNPLTEHVEYSDVIVFMLTHYAIFASGLLLLRTVRANALLILPSALIAALWHLPLPFYLSSHFPLYRYAMEASLFCAGALAGASIQAMSNMWRAVALGLWIISDTALSVIFLSYPSIYDMGRDPYPLWQFPVLGIFMILLMNIIVALLLYTYMQTFNPYHR
jgi:hypothetical protein